MLHVERDGAVATLRYVHPPRAFLTAAALAQLRRIWRSLEQDPSVRVIVLTGEPGRFIVHTEVHEIEAMLKATARLPPLFRWLGLWLLRALLYLLRRAPRVADWLLRDPLASAPINAILAFDAIQRSAKITIAAIDGPCVGGGLELAMCFDYRLASDAAAHVMACPEVRLGLLPGFGGSQRMARLIGRPRALEILVEGRIMTPSEAKEVGLISRLLQRDGFDEEVRQFATSLSRRPPLAVASIKRALADEVWAGLFVELREVTRLTRSRDLAMAVDHYRAALEQTAEIHLLLQKMELLSFKGA